MYKLSILRTHARRWRNTVWRSPNAADGLILDKSGQLTIQPRSTATWSPMPGLPTALEAVRRPVLESLHPTVPYLRPLSAISLSHPFSLYLTFGRRIENGALIMRRFSTNNERDDRDRALEEEVEKKAGWLLKAIFVVTAVGVAYQFFPYMGDNLLQQSISLLHVKDPLFKRMGASRLRRYAIDDGRRMRVVEMGGAHDLLSMLESAKDDKTRKEALKALLALSHSDAVLEILRHAGIAAIVAALPDSAELDELSKCKFDLLERVSREFDEQQPGLC